VVIAGGIVASAYTGRVATVTKTTTATKTVINMPTVELYVSGACLKEVPQTSVFGAYYNSTSQGYTVTLPNGTEDFFPMNACPVPVTPDNYWIDSIVQANPAFIAAENGSVYEATNACNCTQYPNIWSNNGSKWTTLDFVLYSSQAVYPCGPNSYWAYKQLGLILVTIPVSSTGSIQFSEAQIQSGPGDNVFPCTTTAQTT